MVVATALPNTCSLQNPLAGSLGSSAAAAASLVGGSCLTDQVSLAHRGFISQCDYPVTFIAHDDLCSFFCVLSGSCTEFNCCCFFYQVLYILMTHPGWLFCVFTQGFISCVDILFCDSRMTTKKESKSNITNI